MATHSVFSCTHTHVCEDSFYFMLISTVGGTVTNIFKPTEDSTVVSWLPPQPPNGIIHSYRVGINHLNSGERAVTVTWFDASVTSIDISRYADPGQYSAMVWSNSKFSGGY